MHTVELLEQAMDLAKRAGYTIRHECLAGMSGGGCEVKGKKYAFLDVGLDPHEQLDLLLEMLRHEPGIETLTMADDLRELLIARRVA